MFVDEYFINVDPWWNCFQEIYHLNKNHINTIVDFIWKFINTYMLGF